MKFYISNFQMEPDYVFNHSYKVDSFISEKISEELSHLQISFDLIFSISCYEDNPKELILKGQIRGRKKPKEITQFLSFPYKYLEYRTDWVFNLSKFDFVKKQKAYKTFPLSKYVSFITESLKRFFVEENITVKIDFERIEKKIINHLKNNESNFVYQSEELMVLKELIDGSHYSYFEDKEWQLSDIGKNWLKLRDKYFFDKKGNLKLK